MSDEQLPNNHLTQNIDKPLNSSTPPIQPIPQNKVPQPSSPRRYKSYKISLAIVTLLPIFYGITVFIYPNLQLSLSWSIILMLLEFPVQIIVFIDALIYILIVFINNRITKNKKAFWIAVFSLVLVGPLILPLILFSGSSTLTDVLIKLSFLSFISLPIYWYLYIWKEPKQNQLP